MTVDVQIHRKARRLIQHNLDGTISPQQCAWLEDHLELCPTCRRASTQLRLLDSALQRDALEQRAAFHPEHFANQIDAFASVHTKARLKMNIHMLKSFTGTLGYIGLLAALTAGLALIFSSQPSVSVPTTPDPLPVMIENSPTPRPSQTPQPLPEVDSREQIIQLLQTLASTEAAGYRGSGWVHITNENLKTGAAGALEGATIESWVRFEDGACLEGFITSKNHGDAERFFQILVFLPDGLQGDLAALRQNGTSGDVPVSSSLPCAALTEETDSGRLAQRLNPDESQPQSKGPGELTNVTAWYETQDHQAVLAVEATFSSPDNIPPVQREIRRFSLSTGRMLEERILMDWADGSPFGEFNRQQHAEIVSLPPAEISQQFEEYAAELLTYIDPIDGQRTAPTTLPQGVAESSILDRFNYTADSPLSDPDEIRAVLEALRQRSLAELARPGWHLHGPQSVDGMKWEATRAALIHTQADGSCEQVFFYTKDGRYQVQELYLANGDWGLGYDLVNGDFSEGGPAEKPCRLDSVYPVEMLNNTLIELRDLRLGRKVDQLQAWTEIRDGRPTLVLFTDTRYTTPKPSTMDPDTRRLETQDRQQNWIYFDLQNGAYRGASYQVYLENGKVFGEIHQPGGSLNWQMVYFPTLPEELAAAVAAASNNLQAFLAAPAK